MAHRRLSIVTSIACGIVIFAVFFLLGGGLIATIAAILTAAGCMFFMFRTFRSGSTAVNRIIREAGPAVYTSVADLLGEDGTVPGGLVLTGDMLLFGTEQQDLLQIPYAQLAAVENRDGVLWLRTGGAEHRIKVFACDLVVEILKKKLGAPDAVQE